MHRRLLRIAAWDVDLARRRIERDGVCRTLSTKEAELLAHLADRAGDIVPRAELLAAVWGYAPTARTRTLDVTIARLRRKLDDRAAVVLVTVQGLGYRLAVGSAASPAFVPIGREADCAAVAASVAAGAALVTVLGPNGTGTSTFARWAARELGAEFHDEASSDATRGRLTPGRSLLVTAPAPLRLPGEHRHYLGPLESEFSTRLLCNALDRAGAVRTARVDRRLAEIAASLEGHPGLLLAAADELAAAGAGRLGMIAEEFSPRRFATAAVSDPAGPAGDLDALVTSLTAQERHLLEEAVTVPLTLERADAVAGERAVDRLQCLVDRSTLVVTERSYVVPLPLRLWLRARAAATTADATQS